MVQEICREVKGVEVESWIPTDISPHDYHLRPRDIQFLQEASLIVRIGLDFEPALNQVIEAHPDLPCLTLGSFIRKTDRIQNSDRIISENPSDQTNHDHAHSYHAHGTINPHLWLDPLLLLQMTKSLTQALSLEFPENQSTFQYNYRQLENNLLKIHTDLSSGTKFQSRSRPFLTQHDAFAYFFKRYDCNWAGMIESAMDWNMSPKKISALIETSRHQGIHVLFMERGSHQRPPESLIQDLGVEVAVLDPMETGTYEPGIFQKVFNTNIQTLSQSLSPEVPSPVQKAATEPID